MSPRDPTPRLHRSEEQDLYIPIEGITPLILAPVQPTADYGVADSAGFTHQPVEQCGPGFVRGIDARDGSPGQANSEPGEANMAPRKPKTAVASGDGDDFAATSKRIYLKPLEEMILTVPVRGVTPVIPHKWSEKALHQMALKQQQPGVTPKREPKNPEEEAYDSCYWVGDKGAIPATAFKAAMVGACRFYEGITMTAARLLFFVEGEGAQQLVPIEGEPEMRQDTPRNANGTVDLRYRMQFYPWSAVLHVRFLPSMISPDSVWALVDAAGRGGVGDWRPSAPKSSTGTFGQFRTSNINEQQED